MKIISEYKIYSTQQVGVCHLYNKKTNQHAMIGDVEKEWLLKLNQKKEFNLSDLYTIVGDQYYLDFLEALERLNLLQSKEKSLIEKIKKISIFQILIPFNVDLSGLAFSVNTKKYFEIMTAGILGNLFLVTLGIISLLYSQYSTVGVLIIIVNLIMVFINLIPFFDYDGGIILNKFIIVQNQTKYGPFYKKIQMAVVYSIILFTLYGVSSSIGISSGYLILLPPLISGVATYLFMKRRSIVCSFI